jgi:hypothetical protein
MDFFIKKSEASAPKTRGQYGQYKMSYPELIATIKEKMATGGMLSRWEQELIAKHKEPYGIDELQR